MELLNYRLTMGLSFLHWPQAQWDNALDNGTERNGTGANTSAKPNLELGAGWDAAARGCDLPWGYFAQRP